MAKEKLKTIYVCTNCGEVYHRWQGQCSSCKEWNTITEDVIDTAPSAKTSALNSYKRVQFDQLSDIDADDNKNRINTGISELDRVLGGGGGDHRSGG